MLPGRAWICIHALCHDSVAAHWWKSCLHHGMNHHAAKPYTDTKSATDPSWLNHSKVHNIPTLIISIKPCTVVVGLLESLKQMCCLHESRGWQKCSWMRLQIYIYLCSYSLCAWHTWHQAQRWCTKHTISNPLFNQWSSKCVMHRDWNRYQGLTQLCILHATYLSVKFLLIKRLSSSYWRSEQFHLYAY